MIKLLLLVLICFVVYSLISSMLRGPAASRRPKNRSVEGESMVKDPQCGTYLPISDAHRATIRGEEHYFCSQECLKKYKETH